MTSKAMSVDATNTPAEYWLRQVGKAIVISFKEGKNSKGATISRSGRVATRIKSVSLCDSIISLGTESFRIPLAGGAEAAISLLEKAEGAGFSFSIPASISGEFFVNLKVSVEVEDLY